MFKRIIRALRPNPLDQILKKAAKKQHKKFLLEWNRGLGDLALGLFAINHRIREYIPDVEITYLIRENLREGFELLEDVNVIVAPEWQRGENYSIAETLQKLNIDPKQFEVIIEKPDPTYWVKWQRGKLIPKLRWKEEWDALHESFMLSDEFTYIAIQPNAETQYGFWRNWPLTRIKELITELEKHPKMKLILLGFSTEPKFDSPAILDLRGKTNLFQMLSIIKNKVSHLIVPDSGVLTMTYYLDVPFDIQVISLWADSRHGILKQGVFSPNPDLVHRPIYSQQRDLSTVEVSEVLRYIIS